MIKSKFTSIFASTPIKCVVNEETDKYLALASSEELKKFIPDIDVQKEIDILPIAFGAFVANRCNKNGDILDTENTLKIYKRFIHRFIDAEHSRTKVVGVIISASLSEFGTDKPLTEEDVVGKNFPFNVTLGGIIWKAVNNDLANLIEDASDPSSENYAKIFASWEIGFSDLKIIELPQGEKNIANAIEITDEKEKEKLQKYLKCFGGSGIKDGKCYYRMPSENVIPMGIGLTEKPAADVSPVVTNITPNQDKLEATQAQLTETIAVIPNVEISASTTSTEKITIPIISHSQNNNVKEERENVMTKINSIADITDENLKQCTASVISEFIEREVTERAKNFKPSTQQSQDLAGQQTALAQEIETLKQTVAALNREKQDREGMDKFNYRLSEIHASYELPADVAAVVASDVKACSDDQAFASYQKKAAIMLKPYAKAAVSPMHGGKHEHDEIGVTHGEGGPQGKHLSSTQSGPEDKVGDSPKQGHTPPEQGHFGKAAEDEETMAAMTDGPKGGGKDEKTKKKSSTVSGPEDDKKSSKHEKDTDKSEASAIASAIEGAIDNGATEKGGLPNGTSVSISKKEKWATAFAMDGFIVN